ncbi:unnamed protein product, partial [marine sediment metagenome]
LDGDGDLEVVVGSGDDKVHAWHGDGSAVVGWPRSTGGRVSASPALGDLDRDGDLEVVMGSWDGKVYAWHGDGTAVAGWPLSRGGQLHSSAALGDLDGDGGLEVVLAAGWGVSAWHGDGTGVDGWSAFTGLMNPISSSTALADLDGDGDLEVVVGTSGEAASGHPPKVFVWTCDVPTDDVLAWPMFCSDARRTGCYSGTAGPLAVLSSGYVTPASGDTNARFTWRIKYWNTANAAPDRVMVGIWSSATTTTSWRQMWEYDPSDTNCK